MYRFASFLFAVLAPFSVLDAAPSQAAESGLTVSCPSSAQNLTLYGKLLTDQARAAVSATEFKQVRVRVRWRLMGMDATTISTSATQVLNGLSLSQNGLISSVSGTLTFQPTCQFRYVVRVTVSGTEISSGARLSASNEGVVTISSGGEVQIRQRSGTS